MPSRARPGPSLPLPTGLGPHESSTGPSPVDTFTLPPFLPSRARPGSSPLDLGSVNVAIVKIISQHKAELKGYFRQKLYCFHDLTGVLDSKPYFNTIQQQQLRLNLWTNLQAVVYQWWGRRRLMRNVMATLKEACTMRCEITWHKRFCKMIDMQCDGQIPVCDHLRSLISSSVVVVWYTWSSNKITSSYSSNFLVVRAGP